MFYLKTMLFIYITTIYSCNDSEKNVTNLISLNTDINTDGIKIIEITIQNFNGSPADQGTIERWKTSTKTHLPLYADLKTINNTYDVTKIPLTLLVSLSNMKILDISYGSEPDEIKEVMLSKLSEQEILTDPSYPSGPYGNTEVGGIIQDMDFLNADNEEISLSSIRASLLELKEKYKIILIITTAEWCGVCLTHASKWDAIAKEYDPSYSEQ